MVFLEHPEKMRRNIKALKINFSILIIKCNQIYTYINQIENGIWKNLFHEILISKNLEDLINNFSMMEDLISISKLKIKKNVDIISKTEKMILQNVNPTLCMDNMLLSMETK